LALANFGQQRLQGINVSVGGGGRVQHGHQVITAHHTAKKNDRFRSSSCLELLQIVEQEKFRLCANEPEIAPLFAVMRLLCAEIVRQDRRYDSAADWM
jgi:hypothetical protein